MSSLGCFFFFFFCLKVIQTFCYESFANLQDSAEVSWMRLPDRFQLSGLWIKSELRILTFVKTMTLTEMLED